MSSLVGRADSTMIGTAFQPRSPCDHLDAVEVGQPEVEHDHVGVDPGQRVQGRRAGGGDLDLVAAWRAG